MNEFNNRMNVQREVLACVNNRAKVNEQLCGLSDTAITRWAGKNASLASDPVLALLRAISTKLSFLATKSQEQVTEDYKRLSTDVGRLTIELEEELRNHRDASNA